MPGIEETMRGSSLGRVLSLSLECRGCPQSQPRALVTDHSSVLKNIFPGSLCTSRVAGKLSLTELVLKSIFQAFEYQICNYPPKKGNPQSQSY